MTPKEKAIELLELFIPIMENEHYREKAKKCVLILIKQMRMENLRVDNGTLPNEVSDILDERYSFWVEVKRELDLL